MVYCPQDPNQPQLYVIKREFVEEYATGHSSSIGPKLYLKGNATTVAKKLNSRLKPAEYTYTKVEFEDRPYKGHPTYDFWGASGKASFDEHEQRTYDMYETEKAKGPWVVKAAIVSSLA